MVTQAFLVRQRGHLRVRGAVRAALGGVDGLWCKLDAGTGERVRRVGRTRLPFNRVVRNPRELKVVRPIVIRAMFCSLGEDRPGVEEIKTGLAAASGTRRRGARRPRR